MSIITQMDKNKSWPNWPETGSYVTVMFLGSDISSSMLNIYALNILSGYV